MGTNYYLHQDVCAHCGRGDDPLHIGKSYAGWCFALHVGDGCPESLDAWRELWAQPGTVIKDEDGNTIEAPVMLDIIRERVGPHRDGFPVPWTGYGKPGPNGLWRHTHRTTLPPDPDRDTYDLSAGEFS